MIELPYLPPPLPVARQYPTGRFMAAGVILLLMATVFGCFTGAIPLTYVMQQAAARQAMAARAGPPATVIYPSFATTVPAGTLAPTPGKLPRRAGSIVTPTTQYSSSVPTRFGPKPPPTMPLRNVVVSVCLYVAVAAGCGWLGIAAILKRRYVRPLVMVLSTHGIIFGALGTVGVAIGGAIVIPQVTASAGVNGASPPLFAMVIGFVVAGLFMVAIFLVPPIVLLILMRPESVRETAEFYDLQPRWTDGLPLRLLGLILTLAMVAACELFALARPMVPVLTRVVTGIPAALIIVAHVAVTAWASVRVYRREAFGWHLGFWGIIGPIGFLLASSLMLPTQHYLEMVSDQPEMMEMVADHERLFRWLWIGSLAVMLVAFAIYMLRVRPLVEAPATPGAAELTIP